MSVVTHERTRVPPRAEAGSDAGGRPAAPELALAGWALLMLVAFSPAVHATFWAPKAALLVPVAVPGALALLSRARDGHAGARLAIAFVAVAGISTLLADRPLLALLGVYNWGTGWLFLLAVAGCWALGTSLSGPGRRVLASALMLGAGVNAGAAWLQAGLSLPIDAIDPGGSRSAGLLGNPVHLGAISACALVLVAARCGERAGRRHLPLHLLLLAALVAGGVQLSGARSALIPAAVVVAVAARHLGVRRGGAFALAALAGLGMSVGLANVVDPGSRSATERAATSIDPGSGSGRTAVWAAVPAAVAERPLVGWGPGRTRAATSPRTGPELARHEGAGAYVDAHNVVLEQATTTGLLGLAALAGWMVAAVGRARGPLLWFAAVGGVVALAQPLSVAVTPLLAVALGAAAPAGKLRWGRAGRVALVAGTGTAVLASGVFLAGEVSLARGTLDFSEDEVARAERLLPDWPSTADARAWVAAFRAVSEPDDAAWDEAARWARVAAERDPSSPGAWVLLGDIELRRGHEGAARDAYARALRWYPWATRALDGSVYLAWRAGDAERVEELCERRSAVVEGAGCLGDVLRVYEGSPGPPA